MSVIILRVLLYFLFVVLFGVTDGQLQELTHSLHSHSTRDEVRVEVQLPSRLIENKILGNLFTHSRLCYQAVSFDNLVVAVKL